MVWLCASRYPAACRGEYVIDVTVAFPNVGVKKLVAGFARLEKV